MSLSSKVCREFVAQINNRLEYHCETENSQSELDDAIRTSLMSPGKRLRPLLTVLIASSDDNAIDAAVDVGCACEMLHTASLILDDLPSMDDAMVRRGKICTHIEFTESTAILSATALMNKSYEVIAKTENLSAKTRVKLIKLLSQAVGTSGLIGGQFHDLEQEDCNRQEILLRYLKKTSALFEFSVMAGAILSGMNKERREALKTVSHHLGIAFQINDDLLDLYASQAETNKDCGQDQDKMTYISMRSSKDIKKDILQGRDHALAALSTANSGDMLQRVIAEQFDRAIERTAK